MFYFSDEQRKIVVLLKDIGSKKNKLVQVGSNLFFLSIPLSGVDQNQELFLPLSGKKLYQTFCFRKRIFFSQVFKLKLFTVRGIISVV